MYSPVSWLRRLLLLRMLNAGEGLEDPTVSTLSNPGCAASVAVVVVVLISAPPAEPGRGWFSSCWRAAGRRVKGLRIGIVRMALERG